ncbi:MAG: AhpC/TSA family protein [Bizionia sp.]|nr:AhpC/TSA family protein [Bizionia sp.]
MTFKIFIAILISIQAIGQNQNNFTLKGEIKDSETKYLTISNGFISSAFSKFKLTNDKNKVIDNKFIIEGEFEYPHAFRFITNTGDISGLFFIDKTEQAVYIDELGLYNSPKITNSKTNNEYVNNYLPLITNLLSEDENIKKSWNDSLSEVDKSEIIEGRKRIREEKNVVLLKYLGKNPNSFVGMWLFAENFSIYGYNTIYEDMYNAMSNELKNTYSGQGLNQKLKETRISSVNGYLPNATLLEYNGKETKVKFSDLGAKYILVDFWASYCGPCIKQFPNLLDLYKTTSREFFDILAISIDDNKTKKAWSTFLNKQSLPWKQYLDEKGFAEKLFINSVPANFLLDNEGKIVLRDFTVDELDEFLKLKETEN